MDTVRGLPEILGEIQALQGRQKAACVKALNFAGERIRTVAMDYAPRSPTQSQINAHRKTHRRVHRSPTAFSRTKPGGLERSIDFSVDPEKTQLSIFIAANSEGAVYARYIHDFQGSLWNRLGWGSLAKNNPGNVGGMFIPRAISANQKTLAEYLESAIKKAVHL